MSEEDGIICAYAFDGEGGAKPLASPEEIAARRGRPGFVWAHLRLDNDRARDWIATQSGFDATVVPALLNEEPRPRCDIHESRLIVSLRGVNLNPGAEPHDMVSIRMWVDERLVISVRRRVLMAIKDIRDDIARGSGARTSAGFLAELAGKLVARMDPALTDLDDQVDALEDRLLTAPSREIRTRLGAIRRQAVALRRRIAPQREATARMVLLALPWVGHPERDRLREVNDRITRYVEDLDSIRERAAVMQDEVADRVAEQTNRNMYLLSIVAAVFLPLGLITGLLGVNVGGIPGSGASWGFLAVCALLGVIAIAEVLFLRRRWF
jgi:zinc transporter